MPSVDDGLRTPFGRHGNVKMPNAAFSPAKHEYGQPRLLLTDDMAELAEFKSDAEKDTWARKCKIVCTMGPAKRLENRKMTRLLRQVL